MSRALTPCPCHGLPECLRGDPGRDVPSYATLLQMWDAPVVGEPTPPKRPRISPYAAPILLLGGITAVGYIAVGAGLILLGRLAWHAARAVIGGGQ